MQRTSFQKVKINILDIIGVSTEYNCEWILCSHRNPNPGQSGASDESWFYFQCVISLASAERGKGENSQQLFLGFFKGVGGKAPAPLSALIFYTICDTVSQKCCLAVLIISCVFKLNPPRLHSSVFSAPFIFLFPLIIEVSIPFSVV